MTSIRIANAYADLVMNARSTTVAGNNNFDDTSITGTVVQFRTNAPGNDQDFYVELFNGSDSSYLYTPETTSNFLSYVSNGHYNRSIIHRSVPNFVIQGGGFSVAAVETTQERSAPASIYSDAPVVNEPGNSNVRGTIAMAKIADQPDSATNQWFINIDNNDFLDSSNGGYTVFGRVLGEGMKTVDALAAAQTYNAINYYGNQALGELPLWDATLPDIDFLVIESVKALESESLLFSYSITTSNPDTVVASVNAVGDVELSLLEVSNSPVEVTVTATSLLSGESSSDFFTVTTNPSLKTVTGSTYRSVVKINAETSSTKESSLVIATQVSREEFNDGPVGSIVTGSEQDEVLRGLAGWDIINAGAGDDFVRAGNGRDLITGGTGSDELHGDFGWNTYTDQRDGFVDLIAIKSDQFLYNFWYDQAGNSPNGEKSDIIDGLDANDRIMILGVASSDLSFKDDVSHKGVTGVGIYAKGFLEALYIGGDLSASQISTMTSGDNSELVMSNQLWSYWHPETNPALA